MSLAKFLSKSVEQTHQLIRVCYLKPTQPELHTIHLNAGKNEIGRNKETGIRDVRCSKIQLQIDVNLEKCQVKLKVLGVNPCSLNGFMLNKGEETLALHGDVIEIVYGRHPFEIVFKPPPSEAGTISGEGNNSSTVVSPLEGSGGKWDVMEKGDFVTYTSNGVKSSKMIAGYDIDGTITTTKSGNVFPKSIDDWQLLHADIPPKLRKLVADGYKICFFTNQAGIANGKVKLDDFKLKIKAIIAKLNVPVQVFIAIGYGIYRKPALGMWNHLSQNCNDSVVIDFEKSFYVGDAAGRAAQGKTKRDHSCSDRLFALNIGLTFYTPEEHFLNKKPTKWTMPEFNPMQLKNVPHVEPESTKLPSSAPCELIVLVGLPGSGKSVFAERTLKPLGYVILNGDTLGSTNACVSKCEKALAAQKSCVIDNTNVDVATRKKYIQIAKKFNVPCRCFFMNATLGQVQHNIAFRQLTDAKHSRINQVVVNTMKKKYQKPSLGEGFAELAKVNLKYEFQSNDEEKLYKLYLVEK